MRRLLGVLRTESTGPETTPQPGLADVPELIEAARRAGMTVALANGAAAAEPPGAVGLAAYRIVQEALANAARHAPGAPVRVVLRPDGAALDLRVENGGGRPAEGPHRPPGHGLTGMRERARLLGGTFTAGPAEEGFVVVARLPYDDPGNGDA
jgi:signal transduction histidine kinase